MMAYASVLPNPNNQIQSMSTKIPFLFFCLALLALAVCGQNYTSYTQLDNPNHFKKMVFFADLTYAIVYGPTNRTASVYQGYSWKPVTNQVYTDFFMPPSTVEYFKDNLNRSSLLYGGENGSIRKKTFVEEGDYDVSLWTISDDSNHVQAAEANTDGTLYAAFCEQSSKVYIGDLIASTMLIKTLDYSGYGSVSAIQWRPMTSQLLIAGGNTTELQYLQLYDVKANTTEDLVSIAGSKVVDFQFSSDGKFIYFVEESNNQQQTIYRYDIAAKDVVDYLKIEAEQATGIGIRGNFIVIYGTDEVHVWNMLTPEYCGMYLYSLESIPLSPDGNVLITIEDSGLIFEISKLCEDGQYYDAIIDSCKSCQPPCTGCFLTKDHCSDCYIGQYLTKEYTCADCIPACKFCHADTGCDLCIDGWYFDNPKCSSCEKALIGCQICTNSSACLVCQKSTHRVLDDSKNCVCDSQYFESNNTCQLCSSELEGCLTCSSQTSCLTCIDGYVINNDSHKCEVDSGSNYTTLIVIVVLMLAVAVGGLIFWRYWKKKQARKMSSLAQESLQDYEKVEDK